ncbi:hypothetical protein [Anaerotaenia torta]
MAVFLFPVTLVFSVGVGEKLNIYKLSGLPVIKNFTNGNIDI